MNVYSYYGKIHLRLQCHRLNALASVFFCVWLSHTYLPAVGAANGKGLGMVGTRKSVQQRMQLFLLVLLGVIAWFNTIHTRLQESDKHNLLSTNTNKWQFMVKHSS